MTFFLHIILISFSLLSTAYAQSNPLPDGVVATGNKQIRKAWLIDPTTRYNHGVIGDSIEAGGLQVEMDNGKVYAYRLPVDSVFEDRYPRLADLDNDGKDEIYLVRSYLDSGAALSIFEASDSGLTLQAQTSAIGTSHRWLNPVGAGDFSVPGKTEIAVILMPHLYGTLVTYRYDGKNIVETFRGGRYSNHKIGSRNIAKSAVIDINNDGIDEILIPGIDHYSLNIISLKDDKITELQSFHYESIIESDLAINGMSVRFQLSSGEWINESLQ
jgi:hypothetical protein